MSIELGRILRLARKAMNLSAAEVAKHVGVSSPAVYQWEKGGTEPSKANLFAAAALLRIDPEAALEGRLVASAKEVAAGLESLPSNVRPEPNAVPFDRIEPLARDVKIHGVLVGGEDGDFSFNGEVVDWALRPRGLANARNAYALRLVGSSMEPKYEEGDLIYVNPDRPPSLRDFVVIELHPTEDGAPGKAFLKRLKARAPSKYVVEQYNPPLDIEFQRTAVKAVHRVVPLEELLGG